MQLMNKNSNISPWSGKCQSDAWKQEWRRTRYIADCGTDKDPESGKPGQCGDRTDLFSGKGLGEKCMVEAQCDGWGSHQREIMCLGTCNYPKRWTSWFNTYTQDTTYAFKGGKRTWNKEEAQKSSSYGGRTYWMVNMEGFWPTNSGDGPAKWPVEMMECVESATRSFRGCGILAMDVLDGNPQVTCNDNGNVRPCKGVLHPIKGSASSPGSAIRGDGHIRSQPSTLTDAVSYTHLTLPTKA